MSKSVRKWLHGLGAAAIGGGATAVTVMIVDPNTFNIQTGIIKVLEAACVSGLTNACFYLVKSPLPPDDGDDTNTPQAQQDSK